MTETKINAVDLFCGAGGTSTGLYLACKLLGLRLNLLAINHWEKAIETHTANHPGARHLCEDIEAVNPKVAIPGGRLKILVAAPECTHHSRARGGRPINDQQRTHAWAILRWMQELFIENVLIENVKEFMNWGPLDENGKPIKRLKGQTFVAFIEAMKSLDYNVQFRTLNCADYGDPTTRERLFIIARRGNRPIRWPEPTHSREGGTDLVGTTEPWRPAREIIDWSIPGKSIFTRKKPLAENTLKRIAAGCKRFWGADLSPFILNIRGNDGYARGASVDDPLPAVTTSPPLALIDPFVIKLRGTAESQINSSASSVDDPLPTVTAGGIHAGVVQPWVMAMEHSSEGHRRRCYSIDDPMKTITTRDAWAVIAPFLVEYYSNGQPRSIDNPLPTQSTKDRFGLVIPLENGTALVDIRFRMLLPHELAAAQGFPEDYEFAGNRSDRVKQIGNAVPVNTAKALCEALLSQGK